MKCIIAHVAFMSSATNLDVHMVALINGFALLIEDFVGWHRDVEILIQTHSV